MTEARVYPYAILPAGGTPPANLLGLRSAPVSHVGTHALTSWISLLAPFPATRRDLVDHHRVVEVACRLGPALPVRFGTTFTDEPSLTGALVERESKLTATLARVGRNREVAITLEWHDPTPAEPAPQAPPRCEGPGAIYLAERARKWTALDRQRVRGQELAQLTQQACLLAGVASPDVKPRIVPSARVALSCAVLTDPAKAEDVMRRVREAAAGWPDVRLHLAGPWPPYSFSDSE